MIAKATTNTTGDQRNSIFSVIAGDRGKGRDVGSGHLGYGFALNSEGTAPSMFGTLTSPGTFGNFGAGSGLFWVDPVHDMTFVCLTAGLMSEPENLFRFQRLSDMAVAAG